MTARDFGIVFNSYLKFEEELVNAFSAQAEGTDEQLLDEAYIDQQLEAQVARLEFLVENRPLLLNSCILRNNKNNVSDWMYRIRLKRRAGDDSETLKTYSEAINAIEPKDADNGRLSDI